MGGQPCRSFLKLFTIPSRSPASELCSDLIWDKLLKCEQQVFSLKSKQREGRRGKRTKGRTKGEAKGPAPRHLAGLGARALLSSQLPEGLTPAHPEAAGPDQQ